MNIFKKSLLTAAIAWVGVIAPAAIPVRDLLWNLSYLLPAHLVGPVLLLPLFIWTALLIWVINRIWSKSTSTKQTTNH